MKHSGPTPRGRAWEQIQPGDTLCLQVGVYFEYVSLKQSGSAEQPITIRPCPGEIAILDGGVLVFQTSPQTA